MLVIGLTGGIGSGKTSVAQLFAQHNVPIIDADLVARDVTMPDKPGFTSIVNHFGPDIVLANGSLDRAKLRHLIFKDSKQRLWLEKTLHPKIRENMEQQISRLTSPYCIAVIPLLLEVEFFSFINRILVIDATEDQQIQRVMLRDKALKEDVEAILNNQANRQDRCAKAHDVIINDGNLADLLPQVEKLHEFYLSLGRRT
jgi:dephospho-CoA kinase